MYRITLTTRNDSIQQLVDANSAHALVTHALQHYAVERIFIHERVDNGYHSTQQAITTLERALPQIKNRRFLIAKLAKLD
jgi:hypothetical protein